MQAFSYYISKDYYETVQFIENQWIKEVLLLSKSR